MKMCHSSPARNLLSSTLLGVYALQNMRETISMNSIKSLFSRVSKIADSVPPKPSVWSYDSSLLTTEEQEQFVAFMGSLPRPLDLKTLTDEQTRAFHYWLKLEKALRDGNSAEAEKLRRRYGVTLEQLV